MSDLVQRLRNGPRHGYSLDKPYAITESINDAAATMNEAADEIERLQARIDGLRNGRI